MVSEWTHVSAQGGLPVSCGVNDINLRIVLHLWRRKPVGQGGVLQSQVSCHMFTTGIANNFPNGRVVESGGDHACNGKQICEVYSDLMQDSM